jgi:hypothetical protein
MPRPKSDLSRHQIMLGPADIENLNAVARHHGWLTEQGEPNRSRAVRELAAREARRIGRASKTK